MLPRNVYDWNDFQNYIKATFLFEIIIYEHSMRLQIHFHSNNPAL